MGIIKFLSGFFKSSFAGFGGEYWINVQCDRCGEVIRARLDLNNELSVDYSESEGETAFFCRKVLIGQQRCFQPIEVILKFDQNRKLTDRTVSGGQFVEA